MSLFEYWQYDESDPALMLFTAALRAWQLPIQLNHSVLELGCNESDFLPRLRRTDSSLQLTGVDARPTDKGPDGWRFVQGCAWDESLFPAESFDWVLLLGALEHFGLGYYGDPKDPGGDWKTIEAVQRWLKPGGSVYFDVPCNPEPSETAHFRTYAALTVMDSFPIEHCGCCDRDVHDQRFPLKEVARGYSLPEPAAGTWIPQPTVHRVPYHFVAVWAQKVG